MNTLYEKLNRCLLCASTSLKLVLPLAPIPIATPNFALPPELRSDAHKGVPLDLFQCDACGHLQVGHVGNPDFQYKDYIYTTKLSPGLPDHFLHYARDIIARLTPPAGSLVVELGSNDGTLLRAFADCGLRPLGVDPASAIAAAATASGIETLPEFFSDQLAHKIRAEHGAASLVVANNMIANVHDMPGFARGVRELLADDGAFIFETQYGADVVERTLLDTVYHEHVSYFRVKPLLPFFFSVGLAVTGVERVPTKGGSIRVTVRPSLSAKKDESVAAFVAEEEGKAMYQPAYFKQLEDRIRQVRDDLQVIVRRVRGAGGQIAGYGVSVGTMTLLAQFELTHSISFLVDDDPHKDPHLTGPDYSIPVYPASDLATRNPAATIVFAWRYEDLISRRQQAYLAGGGTLLVPLPGVHVAGGKGL